jgi:hypothetical protein
MSTAPSAAACLTPILANLYRATPGLVTLALTDITGNSDFDTTHCRVRDLSVSPSVIVANTTLSPKEWSFSLVAGKHYSLQLVVIQLPAVGSSANLASCATIDMIDDTNQIQTWTVVS